MNLMHQAWSLRSRQTATTVARCASAIAVLVFFASAPHADAPGVYAIRGARLVTVAGAPVESGTIVIRRGLIDAVGESIAVPADAAVIDGKGLAVYPGLIDLGNVGAADQSAPPQPSNLKTTADVERWKRLQIFHPQSRAADALKLDEANLTQLASAGVTSVLALPAGEVVSGQSVLANVVAPPEEPQIGNIVESRRGLAVVRTPIALHVSFPEHPRAAASAYPESLMGVIAFVRQAFMDAQHYHDIMSRRLQPGADRLPQRLALQDDPALEALQAALNRQIPVAFEANEAREIRRALKIASEFKLDPIVTGARSPEDATVDLKEQHARVIYSLNLPQRPKALAPDADEPLRVVRQRMAAIKVPAELAKAGVPFAFESAGLEDPQEFLKNATKVVKAGLPAEAALRALTIGAATMAGVADRLGSLEQGKIANLVVTDGDLFEEKTAIRHVFVDGRPLKLEERPQRSRSVEVGQK
jgi:imidazolonepropionase-like amidohydrolase